MVTFGGLFCLCGFRNIHKFSWKGYNLQALKPDAGRTFNVFLSMAADNVVAGSILIHHIKENLLDTRTLLIDPA